jgi:sulfur-oxidizing protein SoxY
MRVIQRLFASIFFRISRMPTTALPRRSFLYHSRGAAILALAAQAGLLPSTAAAQDWNKLAFDASSLADLIKAYGGAEPTVSKDIMIKAPDIAENGTVVPLEVTSRIPRTESIAVLVERNPSVLAANFSIPDGTEPFVVTRVKMSKTSNVHALIKADGKYFYATREVKVTVGGCGS